MLQKQTVAPELLELLMKLMLEETFDNFNLVGGTSLALQIGHRNSIDIDLFGHELISPDIFLNILNNYGQIQTISRTKNILITQINDIKVDFVNYNYPLLDNIIHSENVRMVSLKDIAAMKLNAIAGRGSKKDFIDLFYLFEIFNLNDMLSFYKQKYHDGSFFLVLKSLSYFVEADNQPLPKVYDHNFSWELCKKKILQEVKKI
jgi:hypothetical protein